VPRLLVVLALVAAVGASAAVASVGRSAGEAARPAAFRDTILLPAKARALAASGSFWGGRYTTTTGETVAIFASDTYPEVQADNQRWADFLASLVHGRELDTVTVYRVTRAELRRQCGAGALGCYAPSRRSIVIPGEDLPQISAAAVLIHEYGHHVAAAQDNEPWPAVDWGTKRWASHVNVCAREKAGRMFPGAEDRARYALNPGEGFAEVYRVLNERRLGLTETPWQAVSHIFYPDDAALALAEQDVVDPWKARTAAAFAGNVRRPGRRVYHLATPLDGWVTARIGGTGAARVALEVVDRRGRRLGRAVARRGSTFVREEICGQRALRVRVTALRGSAVFRLTVSKP
jgi:hypothetical protein